MGTLTALPCCWKRGADVAVAVLAASDKGTAEVLLGATPCSAARCGGGRGLAGAAVVIVVVLLRIVTLSFMLSLFFGVFSPEERGGTAGAGATDAAPSRGVVSREFPRLRGAAAGGGGGSFFADCCCCSSDGMMSAGAAFAAMRRAVDVLTIGETAGVGPLPCCSVGVLARLGGFGGGGGRGGAATSATLEFETTTFPPTI